MLVPFISTPLPISISRMAIPIMVVNVTRYPMIRPAMAIPFPWSSVFLI